MNAAAVALLATLAAASAERPVRVTVVANLAGVAAELKAAIGHNPRESAAYFDLADVCDSVGEPRLAQKTIQELLAAVPDRADVYRRAIDRYRRMRQHGDAIPMAEAWIRAESRNPEAHVALATLYLYHSTRQSWSGIAPSVALGLASADAALALAPGHPPAVEIKRQLLAFKWTITSWDERAGVEAEQKKLDAEFPPPKRQRGSSLRTNIVEATSAAPMLAPSGRPPVWAGAGPITQPRCIECDELRYPKDALDARAHGYVSLTVLIDESGIVHEVRSHAYTIRANAAQQPHPALERAARECIGRWRFEPTLLNGVPVPVLMDVNVEFQLTL